MISREYLALAEQKPISWCVPVDFRLSVLTRSSWFQRRNLKNGYGKTAVRPTITERKMINRWLSFWSKRIKKWLVSRGFSAVVNMPAKLSFASSNLAGTSKTSSYLRNRIRTFSFVCFDFAAKNPVITTFISLYKILCLWYTIGRTQTKFRLLLVRDS